MADIGRLAHVLSQLREPRPGIWGVECDVASRIDEGFVGPPLERAGVQVQHLAGAAEPNSPGPDAALRS